MKIALFNDTANVNHIGCQAVSSVFKKNLKTYDVLHTYPVSSFLYVGKLDADQQLKSIASNKKLMAEIDEVDAIVINGEGSLHHDKGSEYLAIAKVAKQSGKKVFLLNTIFQEMTKNVDVLKDIDDITVREILSQREVEKLGGNSRLVLDSILDAPFEPVSDIDFANSIVFTDYHHERERDAGKWLFDAYINIPKNYGSKATTLYPLKNDNAKNVWKYCVQNMRTANMMFTGRHHGVYLAGMAGIPFVTVGSNSWKIESLIQTSGINIPVCNGPYELYNAYQNAHDNASMFHDFSQFLFEHSKNGLDTFKVLHEVARNAKNTD